MKASQDAIRTMTAPWRKRLQYEIDMIAKMGFVDYFLIVSDFIGYAKSQGIPVGPGRGLGSRLDRVVLPRYH